LLRELPAARVDANPLVRWPGGEVRRFKGVLVAVPELTSIVRPLVWNWRRQRELPLGEGMGYLQISLCSDGAWRSRELPAQLQVDFRHGGERIAQKGQHLRLKEMLRASGVFPWMRERLPLVRGAGEIWCIPGVWQRPSAPVRSSNSVAQRVSIEWRDAPAWRLAESPAP
jgi:tRNA(Ile)-lysidine synthase